MLAKRYLFIYLPILFLFVNSCLTLPADAQTSEGFSPAEANYSLERIQRQTSKGKPSIDELDHTIKYVDDLRSQANQCMVYAQVELDRVSKSLEAIGSKVQGESKKIIQERIALLDKEAELERRLAECRLLVVKAEDITNQVISLRRRLMAHQFLHRQPDIKVLILECYMSAGQWWTDTKYYVSNNSGLEQLETWSKALLAAFCALGAAFGLLLKHRLRGFAVACNGTKFAGRITSAVLSAFARYAPFWLLLGTFGIYMGLLTYSLKPLPYLTILAVGLILYLFLLTAIHIFLVPLPPIQQILFLPSDIARILARRLKVLAVFALAGFLLFITSLSQNLSEHAYQLVHTLFVTCFCPALLWSILPLSRVSGFKRRGKCIYLISALVLLTVLGAEWLGYTNLSAFLLRGMILSLFLYALLLVVRYLLGELFDGLAHGRHEWQKQLRKKIGLKDKKVLSSLLFLKFIISLFVWGVFGLSLLGIWGIFDVGFITYATYMFDGFQIGKTRVIPSRILTGLVLFAILWILTHCFKDNLEKKWLVSTQLAPSAKDALVTITGYAGFTLAILVGLSVAGLDFSSLAIIAGALSVGIGFGLQNIVNNFVSGLILLFERPVKRGDWIVVGDTEGYVKKIRVRSTVIQTFDRSDVIVPNSDLIQVR